MYAVIQTGGKQYRVQAGDVVQVEKLEGDVGTSVRFEQILFASKPGAESAQIFLGKPLLAGATVEGEIVGQGRGEKILIIKMKRRKQYRRTQGHRQSLTQVLVTSVDTGTGEKAVLSAEDKKAVMGKFQSHLTPKGEAFHPRKSLQPNSISRPHLAPKHQEAKAASAKAAPAKKAAAASAGAAATKTAAPKKKAPAKK